MKDAGRGRDASRSGLVAGLLFFTLALAAVLTWQAQVSVRYHHRPEGGLPAGTMIASLTRC